MGVLPKDVHLQIWRQARAKDKFFGGGLMLRIRKEHTSNGSFLLTDCFFRTCSLEYKLSHGSFANPGMRHSSACDAPPPWVRGSHSGFGGKSGPKLISMEDL